MIVDRDGKVSRMYIKCQKCGHRLTDPESQRRGYGPECWGSITGEVRSQGSSYGGLPDDYEVPGQMSLFDYENIEQEDRKSE